MAIIDRKRKLRGRSVSCRSLMSVDRDNMLPRMIYGLAWKKVGHLVWQEASMLTSRTQERTPALVYMAVRAGFRAIDTAGQRKHYRQDLVGPALQQLYDEGIVKREDLWLQTKYTSPSGQELGGYVPYDLNAPLQEKVSRHLGSTSMLIAITRSGNHSNNHLRRCRPNTSIHSCYTVQSL